MKGEKGERRKQELLKIAYKLFIQKGYEETSVDEIIAEAHIAKGTYYYYFPSKEATLEEVINMMISDEVQRAKEILFAPMSVPQKLAGVIASLRPEQNESNITSALNKKENIIMHEKIGSRIVDEAVPLLTEVVSDGVSQGLFSCDHIGERVRVVMIMSRHLFDSGNFTAQDIKVFIDIVEKALGAKSGALGFIRELIGTNMLTVKKEIMNMTASADYIYESLTEYDINKAKRYDLNLGGARQVVISGYEGEKIRIRLASNTLATIQSELKVKIDDVRSGIDVDVSRKKGMPEAVAKDVVVIFVQLPSKYIRKIELAANAKTVEVYSLECDSIEMKIKTKNVVLEDVAGAVEIDCDLDMNIDCRSLKGEIAINQVSATSKICVPDDMVFTAVTKGIGTSIYFEKDGKAVEAFDSPNAENVIELNGMKSELVICTSK